MKAADIPDEAFLGAVHALSLEPQDTIFGPSPLPHWVQVRDLVERLGVPEKVIRAKARKLIRRGLMTGCWCGCRGDLALASPDRRLT